MLIFLCCCLVSRPVDPGIREWAASPESHSSYTNLKEGLCNQESPGRTILRLLALLSFQVLHPDCPSCINEHPGLVNHLSSFGQHLVGGKLASRDTLTKMAHSLWKLIARDCCPTTRHFFNVVEARLPNDDLDVLLDCYWWYRIMGNCNHPTAHVLTWEQTEVELGYSGMSISHKVND